MNIRVVGLSASMALALAFGASSAEAVHAATTWLSKGQLQATLLTADEVNAAVPGAVPVSAAKDTYTARKQKSTTFPFHWWKATVSQGYVREFTPVAGATMTTLPIAAEVYETASPSDARKWVSASGVVSDPSPNIHNEVKNGVFISVLKTPNFVSVNSATRTGRYVVSGTCNGLERDATIACATGVMNAQKTKAG